MFGVVGILGRLPFVCSDSVVLTFSKLSRERRVRWAKHDVIGKKPTLEWVGEDLNSVSLTIRLDTNLGVPPIVGFKVLEKMQTSKEPHLLLIGGEMLGRYVIDSVSENRRFHTGAGVCLVAEVTINMTEYAGEVDDWYSTISNSVSSAVDGAVGAVTDAVSGAVDSVSGAVSGAVDTVTGFLK